VSRHVAVTGTAMEGHGRFVALRLRLPIQNGDVAELCEFTFQLKTQNNGSYELWTPKMK
jgi:hypothetical protein